MPGLATEFFENLVPDVERRMRDFEKFCSSGFRAKVGWRWVKGGLLKILQPQDYFPMEDDLLPDLSEELGD